MSRITWGVEMCLQDLKEVGGAQVADIFKPPAMVTTSVTRTVPSPTMHGGC